MNIPERCGFCLKEVSQHLFKVPCSEPKRYGSCGPDTGFEVLGLASSILKERNEVNDENDRLRRLLWLCHGHDCLYGDDGERQCAKCGIDFKRDSIETIELRKHDLGMQQITDTIILRSICKALVIYDERGIGQITHIIANAVAFFKDEEKRRKV